MSNPVSQDTFIEHVQILQDEISKLQRGIFLSQQTICALKRELKDLQHEFKQALIRLGEVEIKTLKPRAQDSKK